VSAQTLCSACGAGFSAVRCSLVVLDNITHLIPNAWLTSRTTVADRQRPNQSCMGLYLSAIEDWAEQCEARQQAEAEL
jgi:hypothetical protein